MVSKYAWISIIIGADTSSALTVKSTQPVFAIQTVPNSASSASALPSNFVRAANDLGIRDKPLTDETIANKANKQSPQDNTFFDTDHKIDSEDKFHAPKVAPNDKQSESNAGLDDKTPADKVPSTEKGKKGSVILDDYDPSRLGVSADAASDKKGKVLAAVKENKDKEAKDVNEKVKETEVKANSNTGTEGNKAKNFRESIKKDSEVSDKPATDKSDKPATDNSAIKRPELDMPTTDKSGKSTSAPTNANSDVDRPDEARYGRFLGSAIMIIVSEIGDKTFFIAALMAMRHPPLFVFSSSYSAMVVMTVLSMVMGLILPSVLSRKVTTILASVLFFVFGSKMISEAWSMDKNLAATDEMEEVENDIAMHDSGKAMEKAEGGGSIGEDSPTSKLHGKEIKSVMSYVFSPIWVQIFAMTFLGEWGDRSQIATVAMGAGEGWLELLLGCLSGHFVTTVIAVLGGKILAQRLSLRTITLSGAMCFILFGFFYLNDWIHTK